MSAVAILLTAGGLDAVESIGPAPEPQGGTVETTNERTARLASVEISAPVFERSDARAVILRWVRARLSGRSSETLGLDSVAGRHLVMVSLSRQRKTAVVARGEGDDLQSALAQATERLSASVTPAEVDAGIVKVDLALTVGPVARFDAEGRAQLDRSLDGIWLLEADLVLLPEESLSRRLIDSNRDLQSKRLRRYLDEGARAPAVTVDGNPGRAGAAYRIINFDSFVENGSGGFTRLYRGNDLEPEISPSALLEAATSGGLYLVQHQRTDGSFDYSYEPKKDTLSSSYNLLRHAGTCYALVELFQATGDDVFRAAADRGLDYLLTTARPPKPEDAEAGFEAIVSPDEEAKLGGAALASLAMVQYQLATGDDRRLDRVRAFATFMRFQQDADGHFRSKYFYGPPDPKPFESVYYPGEAILALMRLYRIDPQPEWLAAAKDGANWLIEVRDAGKPTSALPHDHWLLMALDELDAVTGDARYAAHARRVAQAIVSAQRRSSTFPDWVGSFYDPPRSTPTATRAEGLVAACRLARRTGTDDTSYIEALRLMARFQRRCQLAPENALYLSRPDRSVGGFRRSLTNWEVRIDYVQHNVSALLGLRSLIEDR